ncbi:MAG: hypothetical protein ACE5FI_08220 [Anaerolineales bacterium]
MARRPDESDLHKLHDIIEATPGKRAAYYAGRLGWHRQKLLRTLASLDAAGVLLAEDGRGGLWPYCPDGEQFAPGVT